MANLVEPTGNLAFLFFGHLRVGCATIAMWLLPSRTSLIHRTGAEPLGTLVLNRASSVTFDDFNKYDNAFMVDAGPSERKLFLVASSAELRQSWVFCRLSSGCGHFECNRDSISSLCRSYSTGDFRAWAWSSHDANFVPSV